MDSFIASIMLWPASVNWPPQGWRFCNGQSFPVNDNYTLYSLLGNTYGGDENNFMLPNMPNVTTASGAELRYIICMQGIIPRPQ